MVFNGGWVVTVARLSANLCQYVAFNPERLSSEEVLDLICCLPLRQLGRLALCICSFLCLPSQDPYDFRYRRVRRSLSLASTSSSSSSSSSESSSSPPPSAVGADFHPYDSHSD